MQALVDASLSVLPGEIHALLGENGAGKSTLVSVASGRLPADSGDVFRDGVSVSVPDPRAAHRAGIALVPQHDVLVGAASVAENLARLDPGAPLFESRRARRDRVAELALRFQLDLGDPDALAGDLPVGTRQRIEIAGALIDDPAVLILDEPTAILAPDEATSLFTALRARAASGKSVVLITHRLAEVFQAADRLTLLARGRTVKAARVSETSPDEIAALLVAGSDVPATAAFGVAPGAPAVRPAVGPPALRLERFSPRGAREEASLEIRPGELAILLAIDGNGADDLASAIAGTRAAAGSIAIGGVPISPGDAGAFRRAGGAFVPADRRAEGLVLEFSIADNLALSSRSFLIDTRRERAAADQAIAAFGVRAPSALSRARQLSGGNQQKLVLARELRTTPSVLVAVHPTRGLDIASTADVRNRLVDAASQGAAVLVVTSDPEEALALAGTIRVVYRGRLSRELPADTPLGVLGRLMAGLS